MTGPAQPSRLSVTKHLYWPTIAWLRVTVYSADDSGGGMSAAPQAQLSISATAAITSDGKSLFSGMF